MTKIDLRKGNSMGALLEVLTCVICTAEHTPHEENFDYHVDVLLGMEGRHVICNSHNYDELVKETA